MEKIQIEKIGAIAIVIMIFLSGMMVLPTTVEATEGLPDLVVRNIGWGHPVIENEELLVTIYVENTGTAPVQDGFWIEVTYASLPGFWQEATETHILWVKPPIEAGAAKAIEFTTIALNTGQGNFEVVLDTTNAIVESNEHNNIFHKCMVAIGVVPNTSFTTNIFLRNDMLMADTFTIEINAATLPDGWGFIGGLPPTTISAQPGGNIVLRETVIVPEENVKNAKIIINATRHSDGETRFVELYVITTPEIGIHFSPITKELVVSGSSYLDEYIEATKTVVSERGMKKVTAYTVTDATGRYITAIIETLSTRNLLIYSILELNNNGIVTTPEKNEFKMTYLIDRNNEIKQFRQEMVYEDSVIYSDVEYSHTKNITIMAGESTAGAHFVEFNGVASLSVRTWNNRIVPIRLDTGSIYQTLEIGLPGFCCWIDCFFLAY